MRESTQQFGNKILFYDPDLVQEPDPALLSTPGDATLGHSKAGRGTVFFVTRNNLDLVLKRYQRGGVISRLIGETYLYLGLKQTRMLREFRLLQAMLKLELPVPRPAAVMVERYGLFYRGRILLQHLPADATLAQRLEKEPLMQETWESIGRCIAKFHAANVFHADLNANNIMLDSDTVYLIDFDKSAFRPEGQNSWRAANLDRLQRSLNKLREVSPSLHFEERGWMALMASYERAMACSDKTVSNRDT